MSDEEYIGLCVESDCRAPVRKLPDGSLVCTRETEHMNGVAAPADGKQWDRLEQPHTPCPACTLLNPLAGTCQKGNEYPVWPSDQPCPDWSYIGDETMARMRRYQGES